MNLEKHFKTATEEFEFTINLGGWKGFNGKKVLMFYPKDNEDNYSEGHVSELSLFGKSMNIKSITKSGMMLYSYDMLDNRITTKIKWGTVELGNTLNKEDVKNIKFEL